MQLPGALRQRVPEGGFVRAEMAEQLVQVQQVAQRVGQFAVVEGMGDAVQHLSLIHI